MTTTTRGPADVGLMLRTMLDRRPEGEAIVPAARGELAVRQVRALERRAVVVVADAREAGVEVEYLGAQPLFDIAPPLRGDAERLGDGPASRETDLVVPRGEQAILRSLANADVEFPLIYVAHEIPKAKAKGIVKVAESAHTEIEAEQAQALVGPVPEPAGAVRLGEELGAALAPGGARTCAGRPSQAVR